LNRKEVEKILKILRKLDWQNQETLKVLYSIFFKIWKIKFSNLHLVAFLISELSRYHPWFGVLVVDYTLEQIRMGLEMNLFKRNQRRLALMKFLGELYNFRMLDTSVIFDCLYVIVRFGHERGVPLPWLTCSLDLKDDYFRSRLVCMLLDTCGQCFKKGSGAKKLDVFLVFFQVWNIN
jgi:regulator of nonsense transcripts 2